MTHALLAGALAAFIACCLLVVTQRWHGRFTLDNAEGIQKFHTRPTPRIGGVGVMAGMLAVLLLAPEAWKSVLVPMLWASLPAFAFGVAEDISKRVGPRARLLATMGSGVLATVLTGTALAHTGLPGLDGALQRWWPLAGVHGGELPLRQDLSGRRWRLCAGFLAGLVGRAAD